ncbi:hypothetical protein [Umezawaea beigongshangensis]|uniref:hypothetical protein n=1 Tax=Umezawaea beigongshangensis TaxID=2780383 RepID=UPI0018F11E71|nr:hypothetical protein [Umezawaea beigongshangensis]
MQRRLAVTTAVLSTALTLGLAACAQQVGGSPVAAPGARASAEPSVTKSSSPRATRSSAGEPTRRTVSSVTPPPAGGSGEVRIAKQKKTEGFDDCALVTPADVETATGGTIDSAEGCVLSTENPSTVILASVTFAELAGDGDKKNLEVGGNTAVQTEQDGRCSVMVHLTDDPDAITPAYLVAVTEFDDVDSCGIALKLVQTGFDKIPDA